MGTNKPGLLTWGYHSDDGWTGVSSAGYYSPLQSFNGKFGHGDTVGCAVNFGKGTLFFTKNGKRLNTFPDMCFHTSRVAELTYFAVDQAFDGVSGRLHWVVGFMHSHGENDLRKTIHVGSRGPVGFSGRCPHLNISW